MIRTRLIGVVATAALIACGGRKDDKVVAAEVAPAPALPADAAIPVDAMLPAVIGPPRPLDGLRPHMKEADVLAWLAQAGVRPLEKTPELPGIIGPFYATAIPGATAWLSFREGRLQTINVHAEETRTLLEPVQARWGNGSMADHTWTHQYTWPASAIGWEASLTAHVPHMSVGRPRLYITATSAPPTETAVVLGDAVFERLGWLVGQSLDVAQQHLGAGLRRETADGEEKAPERGTARQGFATLKTPWHDTAWQLVLHTAPGTETIVAAVVTGQTHEGSRVPLFDALRAAFGEPRPVVSAAGRVEIELAKADVHVHVAENSGWTITVRRSASRR